MRLALAGLALVFIGVGALYPYCSLPTVPKIKQRTTLITQYETLVSNTGYVESGVYAIYAELPGGELVVAGSRFTGQ